jgi:hypothetical protein
MAGNIVVAVDNKTKVKHAVKKVGHKLNSKFVKMYTVYMYLYIIFLYKKKTFSLPYFFFQPFLCFLNFL